jgi:membrane protease YdiL (CAAX protease family)
VVCMSYAFNQFAARRGPLVALGLMILLRISYHTWKGPTYLGAMLIGCVVDGLWYWRFRSVWTLILAHALFNILILYRLVR